MPDNSPESTTSIIHQTHPSVLNSRPEWNKWRTCYEGGQKFIDDHLKKFSDKETTTEFRARKSITPAPVFARAAVNDIRNSIFQHMRDITRIGGTEDYQAAVNGFQDGVDLRGTGMNSFMGRSVLTELLVMGKVGVYVDMPRLSDIRSGLTLADTKNIRPYIYMYRVEDIINWSFSHPSEPSEFNSLLLRDVSLDYDPTSFLPNRTSSRFRYLWIDHETGFVKMRFYNKDGEQIDIAGNPSKEEVQLGLRRIPFVLLDMGGSVMQDVCGYQIALLNVESSDISYTLKANYPYYVEQQDMRTTGSHLTPNANPDGSASDGQQRSHLKEIQTGINQARAYDIGADAPSFINPSSEPLLASMKKQEQYKSDIRKLVNLAVTNIVSGASAESKLMDNQGLESGLSYIGLILETAETKLVKLWTAYEDKRESKQKLAVIKYPERYSLKTEKQRLEEAEKAIEVTRQIPSSAARRELWKVIAENLLTGRVDLKMIQKIFKEIEDSPFTTSDPEIIDMALERGVLDLETAAEALGFDSDAPKEAQKDQAIRLALIQRAQTSPEDGNNTIVPGEQGARGLADADPDPGKAKEEKEASQNPDLQADRNPRVRGRGRKKKRGNK